MVTTVALYSIVDEFFGKTASQWFVALTAKIVKSKTSRTIAPIAKKYLPGQKNKEHWLSAMTRVKSDTSAVQMGAVNDMATMDAYPRAPYASLVRETNRG